MKLKMVARFGRLGVAYFFLIFGPAPYAPAQKDYLSMVNKWHRARLKHIDLEKEAARELNRD